MLVAAVVMRVAVVVHRYLQRCAPSNAILVKAREEEDQLPRPLGI